MGSKFRPDFWLTGFIANLHVFLEFGAELLFTVLSCCKKILYFSSL